MKSVILTFLGLILLFQLTGCSNTSQNTPENSPPIITAITVTPGILTPNYTCTVSVSASDPDQDVIKYEYAASGNIGFTMSAGTVRWTPPALTGNYTIFVKISDGTVDVIATAGVCVGSPSSTANSVPTNNPAPTENPAPSLNHQPAITTINLSVVTINSGTTIGVSILAVDSDNDPLTLHLTCSGSITGSTAPISSSPYRWDLVWTPPTTPATYRLVATVSDPTVSVSASTAIIISPPISALVSVSGNRILDPSGNIILLNGVGMANHVYDDLATVQDWDHNQSDFARIKSWGANTIRFYMHANWFTPQNIQNTWAYLDQNLEWALQNGLYLILDMHYAPGQLMSDLSTLWSSAANRQSLVDIWTQIASRYRNNSRIAGYDLLNEPAPANPNSWWGLAQQLIDAIRGVDDHHVIIAETLNNQAGSSSFPTTLLNDTNLAYSFHFYQPMALTHQGASWTGMPLSVPYPYTQMDYVSYIGGYFSGPGWGNWMAKNTWTELIPTAGQWSTPPANANVGFIEFGTDTNPGTIYCDDVVLIKQNTNGTTENVPITNPSFNQRDADGHLLGWYPDIPNGNSATCNWITSAGHNDQYCIKISNATGSPSYASWSQNNNTPPWYYPKFGFVIESGCKYQLRCWVKGEDTDGSHLAGGYSMMKFNWQQMNLTVYDKGKLQALLEEYTTWGNSHQVPLYLGEWGCIALASENATAYVQDVKDILSAKQIPWTYHVYRDYINQSPWQQRRDFGLLSKAPGLPINDDMSSLSTVIKTILFP